MTRDIMRDSLLTAIESALHAYLGTVRGANIFGTKFEITRPTSHRLKLHSHTVELGPVNFEIVISDY
jgi:hypothetical protein